jgi:hypothetical protein
MSMRTFKVYALGAAAFVAVSAYYYGPTSSPKPAVAAQRLSPETQCDAALLMERATKQINELRAKSLDQRVAEVMDFSPLKLIVERREHEKFCLQVATCYSDPKLAGIRFSTCLDDEERVDEERVEGQEEQQ